MEPTVASRPRPRFFGAPTLGLLLSLVVAVAATGCSSDTATRAAQAKVSAKERALADAQSTAKAKSAQACTATATYISAVDRYGDVLSQTTTTVGDVKTAGDDLGEPRSDAVSAGEEAVAARDAVTVAEQELADAKAALAAASAAAASVPPSKPASASPSPSASATEPTEPTELSQAVLRVQQAEDEFKAAQRSVTDATPLSQAATQFNAAAVALEMAWLQLFSEMGCLTADQQEKAQAAVHDYTAGLQQQLTDAGYYQGKVDGVYGPATSDAVQTLQKTHSLPVTGWLDKASQDALLADLAAKGGATAQAAVASTSALQQTLKLAGFWDGPVDGQWTPALTEALKKAQTELGVPATGAVDAATITAFEKALVALQSPPAPAPSKTPTPPAPSTSPSA
jgi:peptidoglycan hydrolase-like protein with peptidoglycan-binding domain